jgi:hypothetical protein
MYTVPSHALSFEFTEQWALPPLSLTLYRIFLLVSNKNSMIQMYKLVSLSRERRKIRGGERDGEAARAARGLLSTLHNDHIDSNKE